MRSCHRGEGLVQEAVGNNAKSVQPSVLRLATWNIAGGHRSSQAPSRFSVEDQRAAVMNELRRWHRSYECDVVALQECEQVEGYEELNDTHCLVHVSEAKDSRGFVHVYVRRGRGAEIVETTAGDPCVAVRIEMDSAVGKRMSLVVAAVHLPAGEAASGLRQRILKRLLSSVKKREDCLLYTSPSPRD